MLSPKRDLIAAKLFLRLALSGGGPSPRVINVDGHPAYAIAIAELQQTGELSPRYRCRTAPYLNNIITAASGSDEVMPPPGLCRVLFPPCRLSLGEISFWRARLSA